MRNRLCLAIGAAVVLVPCQGIYAAPPSHDGKVVLFGNLHSHSRLSDDVKTKSKMWPKDGFEIADEGGLDFLAITDHHKATDTSRRFFMTQTEYKEKLFDVATDYNAQHAGSFIAIPGIEWGNTATGNHVNIMGAQLLPPDTILDKEYDKLFTWAKDNADFIQLNHPKSWSGKRNRNKQVGNFGEALYTSTKKFVQGANPSVKAVAIICTVAYGHLTGELRKSKQKTHRKMQWENHYKALLNMGFHISPSADQDTHWKNWGVVTAARTAVWADSFAYDDLVDAFQKNRVYATEDDEMAVVYQVKYKGKTYWMGETVPLEKDEDEVTVLVKVWQGAGSDGDPVDEGPYTVAIMSDWDGVGNRKAAEWDEVEIPEDQVASFDLTVVDGEYIYLRVSEQAGKDNPLGDGEDIVNNTTGAPGSDKKRDDMNDSAWTSPIWFVKN